MESTACVSESVFSGTVVPRMWNASVRRSRFGDAALVVFLLAQCLDGVFTYVGIVSFGPGIEANPLVAGLMTAVGHGAGLLAAKGVAMALGITLHVRQVHTAVAVLAGFYVVAAVLPWMAILFS
jgi:nitrate reductase gamma subunit